MDYNLKGEAFLSQTGQQSPDLISALVSLIGSADFFPTFCNVLGEYCGSVHLHMFLYQKDVVPIKLASFPVKFEYHQGVQNYLDYSYIINPIYRSYLSGQASGIYLMSDLLTAGNHKIAEDSDIGIYMETSETIGYRTPGWPKRTSECILFLNLPNGSAIDMTFLNLNSIENSSAWREMLIKQFKVLESILRKQFEVAPETLQLTSQSSDIEEKFQSFGATILTNRERQVVQLILIGHTSNSIALNLEISTTTVKAHRRNIYRKLEISSLPELFNLLLLHIKNS